MRPAPTHARVVVLLCTLLFAACAETPVAPDAVLFDGGTESSISPDSLRSVTVGLVHSCGLDTDGVAYCWGANPLSLLLGRNSTAICPNNNDCGPRPGRVRGNRRYTHLAAGAQHTCGIEEGTGRVYCWGFGPSLGSAVTESQVPIRARTPYPIVQISTGHNHTCGLDTRGIIWCWGANWGGAAGAPVDTSVVVTPIRIAGSRRYTMVSAGGNFTCALARSSDVYCWGQNNEFQIGQYRDWPYDIWYMETPVRVDSTSGSTWVSAGDTHACSVRGGTVICWGNNSAGQSFGHAGGSWHIPAPVPGAPSFSQVSAGRDFTCAMQANGQIWCWGTGAWGQLGNGDTSIALAAPVAGGRSFTTLAQGIGFHRCATDGTGAAFCWGANPWGQAGRTPYSSPTCTGQPCNPVPRPVNGVVAFAASTAE